MKGILIPRIAFNKFGTMLLHSFDFKCVHCKKKNRLEYQFLIEAQKK